ncbi:MAG TPA: putative sulfate exporter family transporter [Pseudonocardia sp.]|uniref:YeiH family protein n=1 Tax=Pseudonocardia sp. TaxID=60912 RepID=UPI002CB61AAF|nr:putative sulfate exporter family transporter [Pseudonocardia sp.]HTF51014.1 putative sulfate exporter family transporter [Pseudonocardia sp.]
MSRATTRPVPTRTPTEATTPVPRWPGSVLARGRLVAPGLVVALFVALAATPLGHAVPVVGAPVFGILLGLVLAAAVKPGDDLRPGLDFAAKPVLQTSIVVLGATLSLREVAGVGLGSLPVMLGTLAIALLGAWLLGRLLGVRGDARILIGVGTGICGASAIAATTAVLKPERAQVAYAIGTIFTFNVVAVLLFPALGHAWGMSPQAFGLWAGTAVNDTSSVVAAAYSFSPAAGPYAVVVKLTRTLTLIPIVLALALWRARRDARATPVPGGGRRPGWVSLPWRKVVPFFLVGFLLASALDTVGLVPTAWDPALTQVGTFLITTALAGIGLSMRWSDIRGAGVRPLLLGGMLWVLVAASSLGLQAATHLL